nr:cyclin-P3-1-like [Ipomoea batatas]
MGGAQALSLDKSSRNVSAATSYENMGLEEYEIGEKGAPRIVWVVGSVVERMIKKNEKMMKGWKQKDVKITAFHGARAPSLGVHQYIDRIFRYSSCSPACFVVAYIYLERFLSQTAGFLTSLNVHRLSITSIMLAAKFLDDDCYNNAYYAKVGGITNSELNKLEMKFLTSLDFRLHVSVDTFNTYCLQLEREGNNGETTQIDRPAKIFGYVCGRARTPTIACRAV